MISWNVVKLNPFQVQQAWKRQTLMGTCQFQFMPNGLSRDRLLTSEQSFTPLDTA